jgi:hypothetical protein
MKPLSFDEFLRALNYQSFNLFKEEYSDLNNQAPDYLIKNLTNDLNIYIKVGGLPEAVLLFLDKQSIEEVENKMPDYLNEIIGSISTDKKEQALLISILNTGLKSLSNPNPKIKITESSFLKNGSRNEIRKAWNLCLTSSLVLTTPCLRNLTDLAIPQFDFSSSKVFPFDIGIANYLFTKANLLPQDSLYESLTFLLLDSQGIICSYPLRNRRQPTDFIIFEKNKCIPIDIKTGNSIFSRGLSQLIKDTKLPLGIIASNSSMKVEKRKNTLVIPILYLSFIKEILENGKNS